MKIICLCGSMKFEDEFRKANIRETLLGNVVLMPLLSAPSLLPGEREILDRVHRAKIRLATEVLVLNVDGYIGKDTRDEMTFAIACGVRIRLLVPCKHDWQDMRNSRIESGEWCPKCGTLRAGHEAGTGKESAQ